MLRRLRIKFVCINMAIVTVMLATIFGMVLHFTQQNLEQESLRMMQALAGMPSRINPPGAFPLESRLPHFIIEYNYEQGIISVDSGVYDLSDRQLLKEIVSQTIAAEEQNGKLREYSLRYLRLSTPRGEKLIFADMSSELSTMENLLKSCAMIGLSSFMLFFVISLLLARWSIRPVEQAWKQQRQFIADASHELKTPLTVISTNAELLQTSIHDPLQCQQCSDHILAMSHQMRGLVESLLALARVDDGSANLTLSPLDFSQLTNNAALPFDPVFFEHGLFLECRIDPGIQVKGSSSHLCQVIEILLDNARKYSNPDTTVELTLSRSGHNLCQLALANRGEEISQEDLTNIFKRFYRGDAARSMNHSYGLGLSIAQRVAEEHKGKIWAESRDGINTFYLQLPTL